MSSKSDFSLRSGVSDYQGYLHQIMDAQREAAELALQVQQASTVSASLEDATAPLQKIHAGLHTKVTAIAGTFDSFRIEELVRRHVQSDVQQLSAEVATLSKRITALGQENDLKRRMLEIAHASSPLPSGMKPEILRGRVSALSSFASSQTTGIPTPVYRFMTNLQADLLRQAEELEKPAPKVPGYGLLEDRPSPMTPKTRASISPEEIHRIQTKPGGFLSAFVNWLGRPHFHPKPSEVKIWIAKYCHLPLATHIEIFDQMRDPSAMTIETMHSSTDLHALANILRHSKTVAAYEEELAKGEDAASTAKTLPSSYARVSSSTPSAPSEGPLPLPSSPPHLLLPAPVVRESPIDPSAKPREKRILPMHPSLSKKSESKKWQWLLGQINKSLRTMDDPRARTISLVVAFTLLDLPATDKFDIYVKLAQAKGLNIDVKNILSVIRFGHLHLGENLDTLRTIILEKMRGAMVKEGLGAEEDQKPVATPPSTSSSSSSSTASTSSTPGHRRVHLGILSGPSGRALHST